ncbi:MAG: hypothetical protein RR636_08415 [Clostridium sp.]|uniref:hypothetical protein n=1 Tax=Clostridium sp. TaxID=1506 RepID=UPI003031F2E5
MDGIKKLTPKVNKKILIIIGGLVWTIAGVNVFLIGYKDVSNTNIIGVIFSVIIFAIFFNFIFYKMAKKHLKRIDSNKNKSLCVFSFFDVKGYIIMAFMMTFGITLRKTGLINHNYLGLFYIGLGFALASGGLIFLINGIRHKKES